MEQFGDADGDEGWQGQISLRTLLLANLPRKAQEIRIEVLWCWIILQ